VRRFLSLTRKKFAMLITVLILAKLLLAVYTPPTDPTVYYLTLDLRSPSPDDRNPWGVLGNSSIYFWNALPITHNDTYILITSRGGLLPASLQLLVLIAKTPIIAADLMTGLILYLLGKNLWPSTNRGSLAAIMWFANPYATFVNEMCGAVDIIPVFTIMLAIYLLLRNRFLLTGLAIASGIALKLFPLVALPAVLYAARARSASAFTLLICVALSLLGTAEYIVWSGFPVFLPYYAQDITELVLGVENYFGYANLYYFMGLATFSVVLTYLILYDYCKARLRDPLSSTLVALLTYAAFLVFQIEYMLWIIPLLIIANLTTRRTIVLHFGILGTAFSLGWLQSGGYAAQLDAITNGLLQSNWISAVTNSPAANQVLLPLLQSFLVAFMLMTMTILAFPERFER